MRKKYHVLLFLVIFGLACISLFLLKNFCKDKKNYSAEEQPAGVFRELTLSVLPTKVHEVTLPPLILERLLSSNHKLEELPQEELRTLIVTGDVLLARSVNYQMHKQRNFKLPFEKVAEVLQNADLTFINLENPIVDGCPLTNGGMVFCGSPKVVEGLVYAGVDVASLANNHAKDWGENGLRSTVEILNQNSIATVVTGEVLVKEVRGLKFAFLGYDTIKTAVNEEEIQSQIKEAKALADVVVVYFHWGIEYVDYPTQKQRNFAHLAVDSGADLVTGSHPHWVQGLEIYQDKVITYSHGNFIFDQMFSEETRTGIVGKYTFFKEHLIDAGFLPVFMGKFPQLHFLDEAEKKRVLDTIEKRSIIE